MMLGEASHTLRKGSHGFMRRMYIQFSIIGFLVWYTSGFVARPFKTSARLDLEQELPLLSQQGQKSVIRRFSAKTIPFTIESLPKSPNPRVFHEISSMCIEAFFNDHKKGRPVPPWKEAQLSYLRMLQQGDLRRRREKECETNVMLVARQVVPAEQHRWKRGEPIILDKSQIYNWDPEHQRMGELMAGDVVGFVEVTKKNFGLGGFRSLGDIDVPKELTSRLNPVRPVLTNLSVTAKARRSGVGSKLAERCEREVLRRWNQNEIVLEVEDDNRNALSFYEKRGYRILFENQACRRYDLSGLWLRKTRCNRYIMRKYPLSSVPLPRTDEVKTSFDKGIQVLLDFRDTVFAGAKV